MKKYLILGMAVVVGLAVVMACYAATESSGAGRPARRPTTATPRGQGRSRGMSRERQIAAVSAIEQQVAKIKEQLESSSRGRQGWQEMSEEERTKLREQYRKDRAQRQKSIGLIEEQLCKLKGRRMLYGSHNDEIEKLKSIHELAVKEKATETAAAIEKMIAEKNKGFKEKMEKLGMPEVSGRGRRGGN